MSNKTIKGGYRWLVEESCYEHRFIASLALGRPLDKEEIVHHINGRRLDNSTSNLCVMPSEQHEFFHGWLDWHKKVKGIYPSREKQLEALILKYSGTLLTDDGVIKSTFCRQAEYRLRQAESEIGCLASEIKISHRPGIGFPGDEWSYFEISSFKLLSSPWSRLPPIIAEALFLRWISTGLMTEPLPPCDSLRVDFQGYDHELSEWTLVALRSGKMIARVGVCELDNPTRTGKISARVVQRDHRWWTD